MSVPHTHPGAYSTREPQLIRYTFHVQVKLVRLSNGTVVRGVYDANLQVAVRISPIPMFVASFPLELSTDQV